MKKYFCKALPCFFINFCIDLIVDVRYNGYKGVDNMNKAKVVDLLASLCLLIGSIINIVEIFIDVHIAISVIATILIFISLILWFVVLKRIKSKK